MEPAGSDVNQDCADTKLADMMEHGGLDDDALDRWTSEKSDSGSGRDDETGFEGTPHYAPAPLPRTIIHRAGDCCLRPQQKQPCVISCCVAHESCRHGRRRERPHFRRCSDGFVRHDLAGRRAALGCQMRCYRTNAITIYFSSRRDEPVIHNDIVMNHVVLTIRNELWDASEPPAQN